MLDPVCHHDSVGVLLPLGRKASWGFAWKVTLNVVPPCSGFVIVKVQNAFNSRNPV